MRKMVFIILGLALLYAILAVSKRAYTGIIKDAPDSVFCILYVPRDCEFQDIWKIAMTAEKLYDNDKCIGLVVAASRPASQVVADCWRVLHTELFQAIVLSIRPTGAFTTAFIAGNILGYYPRYTIVGRKKDLRFAGPVCRLLLGRNTTIIAID